MKYIPQSIITIPNTEDIATPEVGTLDPEGYLDELPITSKPTPSSSEELLSSA